MCIIWSPLKYFQDCDLCSIIHFRKRILLLWNLSCSFSQLLFLGDYYLILIYFSVSKRWNIYFLDFGNKSCKWITVKELQNIVSISFRAYVVSRSLPNLLWSSFSCTFYSYGLPLENIQGVCQVFLMDGYADHHKFDALLILNSLKCLTLIDSLFKISLRLGAIQKLYEPITMF